MAEILGAKTWPTEPGVRGGSPSGVVEDMSRFPVRDSETQGIIGERRVGVTVYIADSRSWVVVSSTPLNAG